MEPWVQAALIFLNLLYGMLMAIGGWLMKIIYDLIRDLKLETEKLRIADAQLREYVVTVQREAIGVVDFKEFRREVLDSLLRVEKKLDDKEDKHHGR